MQKYDSAPKKKESPKLVSIPEDELKNFVIYENKPKKLSDFMNKE